ncbi:MAG: single-stranded DNA-binding protein [Candidatus Omnitrophica bacterium]|jgi:single-strand DNA-binding protein|nr:single-stranded DNA-binding protein [Candidatus Omnitrophota bacterium]
MPGPNLNKVFLIGRLTRDPEMRYTPQGTPVTSFGLAVNKDFVTKTGEKKEDTCFVNLVIWGKRGEIAAEYLKKGSLIFVEGRLTFRSWETQENEKRSTLEVHVDNFQFLERGTQSNQDNLNKSEKNIPDTGENNVQE